MKTEKIHITDKNIDKVSYDFFQRSSNLGGNNKKREMLKRILHKAIQSELTERQRECVLMYYFQNMKMKEIAESFGLSPSTVSRHISAAQKKLRHIVAFYA